MEKCEDRKYIIFFIHLKSSNSFCGKQKLHHAFILCICDENYELRSDISVM